MKHPLNDLTNVLRRPVEIAPSSGHTIMCQYIAANEKKDLFLQYKQVFIDGAPDRNRTCDPQLRKLVLYPTELQTHSVKARSITVFDTIVHATPTRKNAIVMPVQYKFLCHELQKSRTRANTSTTIQGTQYCSSWLVA